MAPHLAAVGLRVLRAGVSLARANISDDPAGNVTKQPDILDPTTERNTKVDPNDHAGKWLETLTGIRIWVMVLVAFLIAVACIGCSTLCIWWSGLPLKQATADAIRRFKEDHARLLRECPEADRNDIFHKGSFSARCDRMFETALRSETAKADPKPTTVSLTKVKGIIKSIWGSHSALKDNNIDWFVEAYIDPAKNDTVDRLVFKNMMAYFELRDRERARGETPPARPGSPGAGACCASSRTADSKV